LYNYKEHNIWRDTIQRTVIPADITNLFFISGFSGISFLISDPGYDGPCIRSKTRTLSDDRTLRTRKSITKGKMVMQCRTGNSFENSHGSQIPVQMTI